MASQSPIIGIDLGTTLSACGYFDGDQVRLFENSLGDTLTPSVVARDPRTQALTVGRIAKDILVTSPESAAALFKRDMGTERVRQVGREAMTPIELSACVLDALRADAERALGCAIDRCVVTVPAYFGEPQRVATKRAAELAGFTVERVLNEPTAAAIAYGLHRADQETSFLVFDLGGGTFDVCVMELFEGLLEVKSVAGESRLGGEDFTDALARLALERAGIEAGELHGRPEEHALLYKRAELLKRQLSRWNTGSLTVPAIGTHDAVTIEVDAAQAASVWRPLLDRLVGPCRAALRGAGIGPKDLADVILVGGATRMPCVRALAAELFDREPHSEDDPDLVVVRGAALQAALCADATAVGDLVITDVASHSLGVATSKRVGTTIATGYFSPVLHRNTAIPTSQSDSFETMEHGQREILLQVYEGEARRVEHNTHIGELRVEGIPARRAGESIRVTFTYDLNGILEVEAEIAATRKKFSKIFHRNGKPLEGVALERARDRLNALKVEPAMRPRYRDAIGRAELLWRDLGPAERDVLTNALSFFEDALASRDSAQIELGHSMLLDICRRFAGDERW